MKTFGFNTDKVEAIIKEIISRLDSSLQLPAQELMNRPKHEMRILLAIAFGGRYSVANELGKIFPTAAAVELIHMAELLLNNKVPFEGDYSPAIIQALAYSLITEAFTALAGLSETVKDNVLHQLNQSLENFFLETSTNPDKKFFISDACILGALTGGNYTLENLKSIVEYGNLFSQAYNLLYSVFENRNTLPKEEIYSQVESILNQLNEMDSQITYFIRLAIKQLEQEYEGAII